MKKIFILILFLFATKHILAQTADTLKASLFTKENITGNWGGVRQELTQNGVMILPRITTFYEGIVDGAKEKDFKFGGKADVQIIFDGAKLGLWKGLKLVTHTELNFGKNINGSGGELLPKNTALFLPGISGEDAFDVSSLFISQSIGTNKTLMLGKINMVDVAGSTRFAGGIGIDNFQHISLVAPPSGLIPPYLFGTLLSVKAKPFNYTLGIFDPQSVVNKTGFEKPFSAGVNFFASIEKPIKIEGKMGSHGIKTVYSTQNGTSLSSLSDLIIPPSVANGVVIKKYRYYVGYSFNQYLYQPDVTIDKGFGIFGMISFSDGDPTPIDWSMNIGIGGNSPFKNRMNDKWGIGFFHTSISNGLKQSANAVSILLNDEQGFETFYNAQIFPWFKLGLQVQIINPILENSKTSTSIGIRSSFKL